METDLYWSLPGPRRALERTMKVLQRGTSVVLRIPRRPALPSLRARVMDAAPSRWEELDVAVLTSIASAPTEILLAIGSQLGCEVGASVRSPGDLLTLDPFVGRRFWADTTQVEEQGLELWHQTLRVAASATKDVEPHARPIFVTVSHARPSTVLADLGLEEQAWFGVISPLDTALYASDRLHAEGVDLDDLTLELMVSISAWDLGVVDDLVARRWSGSLQVANEILEDCRLDLDFDDPVPLGWDGAAAASHEGLTPAQHESWIRGNLEGWSAGSLRVHPALAREFDGRGGIVWRSQVSILYPKIEVARARAIRWASQHRSVKEFYTYEDLLEMEIGTLASAVGRRTQASNPEAADVLRWLRDARNELAHLRPLDEHGLARGRELLDRAPW